MVKLMILYIKCKENDVIIFIFFLSIVNIFRSLIVKMIGNYFKNKDVN